MTIFVFLPLPYFIRKRLGKAFCPLRTKWIPWVVQDIKSSFIYLPFRLPINPPLDIGKTVETFNLQTLFLRLSQIYVPSSVLNNRQPVYLHPSRMDLPLLKSLCSRHPTQVLRTTKIDTLDHRSTRKSGWGSVDCRRDLRQEQDWRMNVK